MDASRSFAASRPRALVGIVFFIESFTSCVMVRIRA
jgi:hypothetical protein